MLYTLVWHADHTMVNNIDNMGFSRRKIVIFITNIKAYYYCNSGYLLM